MKSECHILGLTQEIRKMFGKTFVDEASVSHIEDKEERSIDIFDDILKVFNENK